MQPTEKAAPSRLANLKELISLISYSSQAQVEISAILEEFQQRIYSLEEDRKRLIADYRSVNDKCISLERRYSELLYKFSEVWTVGR